MGILIAAMFGDNAARELGYDPLGLSDWAGLWSTLHYAAWKLRRVDCRRETNPVRS
jgi:hypothetical protein